MIDLYYWASANAHKITIFLEETGTEYRIIPINVGRGEQSASEFVAIAPNRKIPVIIDHAPADGGEPIRVFESGTILCYLADKIGAFISTDFRTRLETLQWLFWQVGGLGPIGGQANHFRNFASEPIPYAIERYGTEFDKLVGVLDGQLQGRNFITGDYSIADMACYPWIAATLRRGQLDLAAFPNVARWHEAIRTRPATERAYARAIEVVPEYSTPFTRSNLDDNARRALFGEYAVKSPAPN